MPPGFSGHSATRVDVWVPLAAAMRDTPGWNRDAFRNFVSIIARVEPGDGGRGRRPGERGPRAPRLARRASTEATWRPPNGASPMPLPASRSSSSSSGSRTRRRCSSCAARAAGASRPSARPSARRADASSPGPARSRDPGVDGDGRCAGALILARRGGPPAAAGRRDRERGSHAPYACCWRSRPASARLCSRPLTGLLQLPRHLRAGDLSGAGSRRASKPGLPDAAAGADDAVGRVDRRRGHVRPQPLQPDGAGLRDAPERRRPGRLRAGTGPGRGAGRDLQVGARARQVDARRRGGDGREVDAVRGISTCRRLAFRGWPNRRASTVSCRS